MDISTIYYCRECRVSHSRSIRNLKNAFLEKEEIVTSQLLNTNRELGVLKDYAWNNSVKSPAAIRALAEMAIDISADWKPGRRITVAFMGGEKEVTDRVIRHAKRWMDFANIQFDFKPPKRETADIRISFDTEDGSWSAVGMECLTIDKTLPTMNFGWLSPTLNDVEFRQVVLHEFGHALGCIHEHQRPDNGIPWNKKKVYAYYKKTDGWKPEEVDEQVFFKYDESQIRANKMDSKSIMMYAVPEELTTGNYSVPWNDRLSAADKKFIASIYPPS